VAAGQAGRAPVLNGEDAEMLYAEHAVPIAPHRRPSNEAEVGGGVGRRHGGAVLLDKQMDRYKERVKDRNSIQERLKERQHHRASQQQVYPCLHACICTHTHRMGGRGGERAKTQQRRKERQRPFFAPRSNRCVRECARACTCRGLILSES